ncbi:MAG: POTRA domain-containing protein [Oligoflexia bacterium]|nr:POTRA domain-containing protein [Oligoflexia bacterium]
MKRVKIALSLFLLAFIFFGSAHNSVEAAPTPAVTIEQVEIEGVTVLPPEAVEAAVEVESGEPLDQIKVTRTVDNLRERYRAMGYEQAVIGARLVRREGPRNKAQFILEMKAVEGNPTRILSMNFSIPGEGGADDSGEVGDLGYRTWRHLEKKLVSSAAIKPGEILTQERIAAIRRSIQDVFVSEEYIGARVEDFDVVAVSPPAANSPLGALPTGKWVKVNARFRPGERVSFGYRGNEVINKSRLDAIVDEQRNLGLGKDYVTAIQKRIEDEYHSLGYANVSITPYTFESPQVGPRGARSRHVTYVIDEGPRVQIESINFEGNSFFTEAQLRDQFEKVAPEVVQRGYYVEKDVQHGLDLTIEWMKSQGFLSAKLTTVSKSYPLKPLPQEKESTVKLSVYLYEGDQTFVRRLSMSGVNVFDRAMIAKYLGVTEGKPLNLFLLSEGIQSIKSAYRAKGYLTVAIINENTEHLVKYSDENRLADIDLDVSEGPHYHVTRIDVEGRSKTKESVILRECSLKAGDIVEEPKLVETETRLRRMGLFSIAKVRAVPDPDDSNGRVIKITVEEALPGVIAGGPGFRNDLGIRGFAELGYTNLWGDGHSVFLDLAANRRVNLVTPDYHFGEYQTQLAYNWPWFAGYDLTFRPTLNLSGTEYTNFDATIVGLALTWEKKIFKDPNLIGIFTYSLQRVNQFNAYDAKDDGQFRIGSIIPTLRLDMRDNPLAPTSGLYAETSFEWADPVFFSQNAESPIGYTRFQFRTDYTVPLMAGATWFLSFRGGLERSTVSTGGNAEVGYGSIPLIKRFALGGISSLRGYQEQELNINNVTYLTGSASYVNYRTQIDFPFAGSLKFGPFLDAANLQIDTFSFGNLLYGAGFGIRYMTPVGPVSLDYGWKLNAPSAIVDPNTAQSNFYFSVGVI